MLNRTGSCITAVKRCFGSGFGGLIFQRTIFIRTEETPNENAIKFKPGQRISNRVIEITGSDSAAILKVKGARARMLVSDLLEIEGVSGLMFGENFITVNKKKDAEWSFVKPEVYGKLTDYFDGNSPEVIDFDGNLESSVNPLSEVAQYINEILDLRIRPAVQGDGGDVQFRSFDCETGIVSLSLRGACRSCPSSSATLKHGIEGMLMHYVPEVKGVEQIFDEQNEI